MGRGVVTLIPVLSVLMAGKPQKEGTMRQTALSFFFVIVCLPCLAEPATDFELRVAYCFGVLQVSQERSAKGADELCAIAPELCDQVRAITGGTQTHGLDRFRAYLRLKSLDREKHEGLIFAIRQGRSDGGRHRPPAPSWCIKRPEGAMHCYEEWLLKNHPDEMANRTRIGRCFSMESELPF